ncbi:DUF4258 domain-containing protein [Novispirillum itersonii]|uniref:DUF4258 domain-containing protein n=1 Tax=Novispirillum itersonii TaxID=189 RepID=UPI000361EA24|nr:DUF4258 domain-containing protein [Novispirillum itersonii]
MPDPIPFRRPVNWQALRASDAERIVRERSEKTENVKLSEHAFDRIEERSIIADDVYDILRTGFIDGEPRADEDAWTVVMTKRMPGTRRAGVVTLIMQQDAAVFVKTVEWMDWTR